MNITRAIITFVDPVTKRKKFVTDVSRTSVYSSDYRVDAKIFNDLSVVGRKSKRALRILNSKSPGMSHSVIVESI